MIRNALPNGTHHGLMYAIGKYSQKVGAFTGPCKGDSGGSLVVDDERGRKTIAGIVSGGVGCGQGYPGWYTKVGSYVEWMCCIMDKMNELGYDYYKVEQECIKVAEEEERKNRI